MNKLTKRTLLIFMSLVLLMLLSGTAVWAKGGVDIKQQMSQKELAEKLRSSDLGKETKQTLEKNGETAIFTYKYFTEEELKKLGIDKQSVSQGQIENHFVQSSVYTPINPSIMANVGVFNFNCGWGQDAFAAWTVDGNGPVLTTNSVVEHTNGDINYVYDSTIAGPNPGLVSLWVEVPSNNWRVVTTFWAYNGGTAGVWTRFCW